VVDVRSISVDESQVAEAGRRGSEDETLEPRGGDRTSVARVDQHVQISALLAADGELHDGLIVRRRHRGYSQIDVLFRQHADEEITGEHLRPFVGRVATADRARDVFAGNDLGG
jgi:hypothetical protein